MNQNINDWSYCNLTISLLTKELSDLYSIEQLMRELKDDEGDLSFFEHVPVPYCLISTCGFESPSDEANNENETGYRYLHDFTTSEWGCSFDAVSPKIEYQDDECVHYSFKTLHNPPLAWLAVVSQLYPKMMFELEAVNELDLWDSFSVVYIGGDQVDHRFDKKQKNK